MAWWRIALLVLGSLCWTFGVFGYFDEQQRLRNTLLDWWVAATESSESASQKARIVSQKAASLGRRVLDHVFGTKLLGARFFVGSVAMTHAALSCFIFATAVGDVEFNLVSLWLAGLPLALLAPHKSSFNAARWCGAGVYLSGWAIIVLSYRDGALVVMAILSAYFIVGIATDLVAWPLNARILRIAEASHFSAWLMSLLVLGPLVIGAFGLDALSPALLAPMAEIQFLGQLAASFLVPVALNLVLALALVSVSVVMLFTVAGWTVASRVLNALYENGSTRSQVKAVGGVLVGLAFADKLTEFLKVLGVQ